MKDTSIRLKYGKKSGNLTRGIVAGILVLLLGMAAYSVFSRDINWAGRSREARYLGRAAVRNGQHERARRYYEEALANDPYDWRIHLALGDLLYHHLNFQENALRHYLIALAYSPTAEIEQETEAKIRILSLLRSGELEDPRNALDDMSVAVEHNARGIFARRLAPDIRDDVEAYWQGWRERGRGRIAYCRVETGPNGTYEAMVELDFPDGTSMSMHFTCILRDLWRLRVSFP